MHHIHHTCQAVPGGQRLSMYTSRGQAMGNISSNNTPAVVVVWWMGRGMGQLPRCLHPSSTSEWHAMYAGLLALLESSQVLPDSPAQAIVPSLVLSICLSTWHDMI
jgi:hypothetical protein